jgi:ribosomal peptide maturation radical SAM protein 1
VLWQTNRQSRGPASVAADVLLINLPFAPLAQPSLAFSLFKPILARAGFRSLILYENLQFALNIGRELYDYIADYRPRTEFLLGELLFSQSLNNRDLSDYLTELLRRHGTGTPRDTIARVVSARQEIHRFIASLATKLVALGPKVICFSSLFQQHTAALSLANALRARSEELVLVMGGSNCEGEMGEQTAASFAALDFVVSGAGELVLPKLLSHLLLQSPATALKGVFPTARRRYFPRPPSMFAEEGSLDDLPYPDFDDYFEQLNEAYGADVPDVLLPVETSRGCWWGVKNHCTFCGLNGATMQSRQKKPERAFRELRHLSIRYPAGRLTPVDNILPHDYFKTLLPRLSSTPVGNLFYEVKANLKREHLRLLKSANVVEIQPGIESLSDMALRRMRKGVSALQNVLLLRNTKDLGIKVFWNVLFGFPGETEQEYLDQAHLFESISHLPPPLKAIQVRVDRFSPLYFDHRVLGITHLRPVDAYSKLYPNLSNREIERIAYYFDTEFPERGLYAGLQDRLCTMVEHWQAEYPASYLAFVRSGDLRIIVDTRIGSNERVRHVSDEEEILLDVTEEALHRDTLLEKMTNFMPADRAKTLISTWISLRLLLEVDGTIVSVVERGAETGDVMAALRYRSDERVIFGTAEPVRTWVYGGNSAAPAFRERLASIAMSRHIQPRDSSSTPLHNLDESDTAPRYHGVIHAR